MGPGWWQLALAIVVGVLLFGGRGRISSIMADLGRGITSFRKGLSEDDSAKEIEQNEVVDVTPEKDKSDTT